MSDSPIITLITDFGLDDPYVGAMKARVLRACPRARLVDLTHGVPPQDLYAGAFVLSANWEAFPPGTVHLAVVDPGVGTARRALAVRRSGHFFVAPDNGLLEGVIEEAEQIVVLDPERVVGAAAAARMSATFHGRDLFAPAAGRLGAGEVPGMLGMAVAGGTVVRLGPTVFVSADHVEGRVVWVDHFGNLITAIRPSDLPRGLDDQLLVVEVGGRSLAGVARTFADVAPGADLAYWGSHGTLELARREGDLAAAWRVEAGDRVRVRAAAV